MNRIAWVKPGKTSDQPLKLQFLPPFWDKEYNTTMTFCGSVGTMIHLCKHTFIHLHHLNTFTPLFSSSVSYKSNNVLITTYAQVAESGLRHQT